MVTRRNSAALNDSDLFSDRKMNSGSDGAGPGEWITAHCDGGSRGNPGPAGYGALIQGADGGVIAELSEFLGVRTNNYAEYAGLLACLQYALDQNYRCLRVVSDSELMVNQVQGRYKVKSPDLKPLCEEAKRLIARLERFEISHALRHKNKEADRLANEAMDLGTGRGAGKGTGNGASSHLAHGDLPSRSGVPELRSKSEPESHAAPESASTTKQAAAATLEAKGPHIGEAVEVSGGMLRGFTRDGVVHLLGRERLPDGIFVKIIRE